MKKLTSFVEKAWKVIITVLPVLFDLTVVELCSSGAHHAAELEQYPLAFYCVVLLAVYLAVRLMGYPYNQLKKGKK